MQLVMLAAGESSRLYPYNKKHKSLIALCGESIIVHALRSVKRSAINEIILIVNREEDFREILGNGKKYGVKITYVVQKSPTGMGDAVLLAEKYIKGDFFVAHSTRLEFDELKQDLDKKRLTNKKTILLVEKHNDLGSFGTIKTEGKDKVTRVIEKPDPKVEQSGYKILGLYFLNHEFLGILKKTKKSQYSFEDALDSYAKEGNVIFSVTSKPTVSLKYPWHILSCKDYLVAKLRRKISKSANVSKTAIIEGNVVVEDGAVISENAILKGPCYVGRGAFVGTNSLLRNGTVLEENAVVGANAEVKNTLIMSSSKMHSGVLEDSIIGENARVGAGITTANTRIDRKTIGVMVRNEKKDSGFKNLGFFLGSNSQLGAKVTTMPGVIIGNNTIIGPATVVMGNVDSDTTYYTKFKEIVSKKNK